MMRIRLQRTVTGHALEVVTTQWFVHVWLHSFEWPWRFADDGMLCFGLAWISFNVFNIKAA